MGIYDVVTSLFNHDSIYDPSNYWLSLANAMKTHSDRLPDLLDLVHTGVDDVDGRVDELVRIITPENVVQVKGMILDLLDRSGHFARIFTVSL